MTLSDFKYAARLLVKRPGFTLLSVAMLVGGLGISLYTFAVLSTMLYGEVPLPDGNSIVKIGAGNWVDIEPLDAFEVAELARGSASFAELGGYRSSRVAVGEPSASRSLRSVASDWRIFAFTRTQPLRGRGFVADDHSAGAEPVAVLSYETWHAVFAGEEGAVGELVRIDGRLTRIVGVMPQGYAFPENAQLWLPLALVLFAMHLGFSIGAGTLAILGAAVPAVVSACMLLSILLAVRGVARLEPSVALRAD